MKNRQKASTMRTRWWATMVLLSFVSIAVMHAQETALKRKPFADSCKTSEDGVMRGWLVEYPWPDQDDASQGWRNVASTLVITKHGRVVRRIQADQSFWSWNFWNGGREVVVQEGPVHGNSWFMRLNVRTGKRRETWKGDVESRDAPAWVKAAAAD